MVLYRCICLYTGCIGIMIHQENEYYLFSWFIFILCFNLQQILKQWLIMIFNICVCIGNANICMYICRDLWERKDSCAVQSAAIQQRIMNNCNIVLILAKRSHLKQRNSLDKSSMISNKDFKDAQSNAETLLLTGSQVINQIKRSLANYRRKLILVHLNALPRISTHLDQWKVESVISWKASDKLSLKSWTK